MDQMSAFTTSNEVDKILPALCKFQGLGLRVAKTEKNEVFRSHYADLGAVLDTIQKPLAECDLVVVQAPMPDDMLCTTIYHTSGQYVRSVFDMVPVDVLLSRATPDQAARFGVGPQQKGSAITYARRYMLVAMLCLNVVEDDDDGNAANNNSSTASKPSLSKGAVAASKGQQKPDQPLLDKQLEKPKLPANEAERVVLAKTKILEKPINDLEAFEKLENAVLKNLQQKSMGADAASGLLKDLLVHSARSMGKEALVPVLGKKALDMRSKLLLTEADYAEMVAAFEKVALE
jgi:hypothetical protein